MAKLRSSYLMSRHCQSSWIFVNCELRSYANHVSLFTIARAHVRYCFLRAGRLRERNKLPEESILKHAPLKLARRRLDIDDFWLSWSYVRNFRTWNTGPSSCSSLIEMRRIVHWSVPKLWQCWMDSAQVVTLQGVVCHYAHLLFLRRNYTVDYWELGSSADRLRVLSFLEILFCVRDNESNNSGRIIFSIIISTTEAGF